VPAAVQAVQDNLNAQIAAGQADAAPIEFPENSPEQYALASAQVAAGNYQTAAQADAALQSALGRGTPRVYSADYSTSVYQKAIDAGSTPAQAEALRQQAILDYVPGNFDPITGVPYRILDTRTDAQKLAWEAANKVGTLANLQASRQAVKPPVSTLSRLQATTIRRRA
jgi:hypothetical protein